MENITFVNESGMRKDLPPGSKNTRYYCASCSSYIGEDATRPLGVFALPLHRAVGGGALLPDQYKPNHHIFYADRVADVNDSVPKWVTLPEGKLVEPGTKPTNTVPAAEGATRPVIAGGPQWDATRGMYTLHSIATCQLPESLSLIINFSSIRQRLVSQRRSTAVTDSCTGESRLSFYRE
jgi:hypothetical protein